MATDPDGGFLSLLDKYHAEAVVRYAMVLAFYMQTCCLL